MDGLGIALPVELNFPPPVSLPAGLKQTNLRQINYNQIPVTNGTPAATEIQVIIPQLDACFLDPHSTFLEVDATVSVTFTVPSVNESAFVLSPSNSNGGIIGSGASIFQRYQLYLNNAILSDDESEFGLISYLQLLLSLNKVQRQAMAAVLGLHPTNPNGIWGAPFHGHDMHHRASMTVSGAGLSVAAGTANTIVGANAYPGGAWNPIHGAFWAKQGAAAAGTIILTCVQDMQFNIMLPGLIGSGNDKLFPLFNGPTMIKLYTDAFANYFGLDFGQGITGTPAAYTPTSQYLQINTVHFVGDFVRCDPASFNAVMSGLPNPNMFVLKTTAWQAATAPLSAGSSGISDVLIPHRRASIKVLYCLFNPQSTASIQLNSTAANRNLHSKFSSVCPNLTNGTCVALNGVNYPQQTYDPMARPAEVLTTIYKTLQTWANDGIKPLDPASFYVCDGWNNGGVGVGGATFWNAGIISVPTFGAQSYWRTWDTTVFRTPITSTSPISVLTNQTCLPPFAEIVVTPAVAGTANGITHSTGGLPAFVTANTTLALTDKTAPIQSSTMATNAAFMFMEGTTSSENTTVAPIPNMQSQACHTPWSNQFILAFDFEHLARNTALSGTSSLTGSFFLRMNIGCPLRLGYLIYFVVGFDMLTILDTALRTAAVKM